MTRRRITVLAHNIRSLWNVGSLFRTSDAFGVQKIYLTGYTATPPRREISKTALGAEEWIEWEYKKNPLSVIDSLKSEGWEIVALEQTKDSVDLKVFEPLEKTCLILGHEVTGVPDELLEVCDRSVEIQMHGKKESINVAVAAGVVLHYLSASLFEG